MPTKSTPPKLKAAPSQVLSDEATGMYREVDLTGAPALLPPGMLRPRQKVPLFAVADEVQLTNVGEDVKIDVALEMIAKIDEALESIAVDPVAYVAWVRSEGVNEEEIVALFARYVNGLGDSGRSAN